MFRLLKYIIKQRFADIIFINKIIWYKFKIKHKHFRFEIFLSQNLIIKLRNNGNILFSQRAPSANPTTSKKQSQNIGIFP